MPYSNGKITAPVSIYDVQRALGSSSPDLGTLCKHSAINVWAKYKPVQKNLIDTVTGQWDFTNNRWLNSATWWKGSGSFQVGGIEVKTATLLGPASTQGTLLSYYEGSDPMNGWVYQRPTGGSIQPYRLTDFAGYNHKAPPPLARFYVTEEIIQDGHFTASALMQMNDVANADYLSLGDFSASAFPNGLYFGVVFTQNGDVKLVVTNDTVNVSQLRVNFSGSGNMLPLGDYTVYPILCRDQIPITQTYQTQNLFLTCPMVSPVQTQIVSSSSTVDVQLTPTYTIGQLRVSMNIANNTGSTITNVRWYLSDSSAQPSGTGTLISDISAGSSADVLNVAYTSGQYFHVSFTYNGSTYWKHLQLLDPSYNNN